MLMLKIATNFQLFKIHFLGMNTPSIFSDILDETENVCVEEDSVNMEACATFLNLLTSQQIAEQLTVKAAVSKPNH